MGEKAELGERHGRPSQCSASQCSAIAVQCHRRSAIALQRLSLAADGAGMDAPACNWRLATAREFNASVPPEQRTLKHNFRSCTSPFRHSCLGSCRDSQHYLMGWSPLRRICADAADDGPARKLAALLRTHVHAPTCRLSLAGDSIMHDVFVALLAGALSTPGFDVFACSIGNGGPEPTEWKALETEGFCAGSKWSRGLESEMARGVGRSFTSWAILNASRSTGLRDAESSGASSCPTVTIQYWETGRDYSGSKWANRRGERPKAALVGAVSSVILLSVGSHANNLAALHALWQRDVLPYLSWLKRTAAEAEGGVGTRAANHSHQAVGTSTVGARAVDGTIEAGVLPTRVLWLETPPQHFQTAEGDGSYRVGSNRSADSTTRKRCVPVDPRSSRWRSDAFAAWLAPQEPPRPSEAFGGTWSVVRTFGVFLPHHDLHPRYRFVARKESFFFECAANAAHAMHVAVYSGIPNAQAMHATRMPSCRAHAHAMHTLASTAVEEWMS